MIRKLICAVALLVGGMVAAHAAPVLTVTPSVSNVTVGQVFTLDIRIEGVTDLFGWELDMNWDIAGLLSASPATVGNFMGLGQTFDGGTVSNVAGSITDLFSAASGATGFDGAGLLAQVSFTALAVGIANVSLLNVTLINSNLDDIFFSWPDDARSAMVTSARDGGGGNTPEPATLALVALALVGAAVAQRRKA